MTASASTTSTGSTGRARTAKKDRATKETTITASLAVRVNATVSPALKAPVAGLSATAVIVGVGGVGVLIPVL